MARNVILSYLASILLIAILFSQTCSNFSVSKSARTLIEEGHAQTGQIGSKVKVELFLEKLSLAYCGDNGIARSGEIWIQSSILWEQANAEMLRHQTRLFGEYGGWKDNETRELKKRSAEALAYENQADCPVQTHLHVSFLTWDNDDAVIIAVFAKLLVDAVAAAAAAKGVPVPTSVIKGLIDKITSSHDPLGYFVGTIDFPDPCPLQPGQSLESRSSIQLDNIFPKDSWPSRLGTYPEHIGTLFYRVRVSKFWVLSSNYCWTYDPPSIGTPNYTQLQTMDFGQWCEAVVSTTLGLQGTLPYNPLVSSGDWLLYKVYYDTDNRTATGGSSGAEYMLTLEFQGTDQPPTATLQVWDNGTYKEIADGCYDYRISDDRNFLYLNVDLDKLGNPVGPIASWAMVSGLVDGVVCFDVLPDDAPTETLFNTPSYVFCQIGPQVVSVDPSSGWYDVNRSSSISIEFNKAMNQSSVASAFSMNPSCNGSSSWQGNTFTFKPSEDLQPFTNYTVTVNSTAQDRVSVPLESDFTFNFLTESLPLYTCTAAGVKKSRFVWNDSIYMAGEQFPPNATVDLYVVDHVDLSDGDSIVPRNVTTVTTNINGTILPTLAWKAPPIVEEAEFNVMVDANRDGIFQYAIDRIDRMGIGLIIQKHDLATVDVQSSKTSVFRGACAEINWTITNHGNFNETFNTILYLNNLTKPTPTQSTTFWTRGDANRDGYIDEIDLYIIAANNGWSGPAGQNPADVNSDGLVNSLDLIRCSTNIGEDIWTYFGLSPTPINRQNMTLTSKDSAIIFFTWNTTGLALGNYTITAYACPLLDETYTTNNAFSSWIVVTLIPGDVNGNGVVDIFDAIILSNAYGSQLNGDHWNPDADINKDYYVDIYDAILLAGNYGRTV